MRDGENADVKSHSKVCILICIALKLQKGHKRVFIYQGNSVVEHNFTSLS